MQAGANQLDFESPEVGRHHVLLKHQLGRIAVLLIDELGGARAIPPERRGDDHQQADAEQKQQFQFQLGLAEDAFERVVGHEGLLYAERKRERKTKSKSEYRNPKQIKWESE